MISNDPRLKERIRIDGRGDAEAAAVVDADLGGDVVEELGRDDVPRFLEADADGHRSLVLPVIVPRGPGLAVPAVDESRRLVHDQAGRSEAVLDGGRVEEGLDGRAGLARRLHRPVELARPERIAADHGFDLAGLGLDGQEPAVPDRILVEGDLGLLGRLVDGVDPDLDDVAALDEGTRGKSALVQPMSLFVIRPVKLLTRTVASVRSGREDDGVVDLLRLEKLVAPALEPLLLERGLSLVDEALSDSGAAARRFGLSARQPFFAFSTSRSPFRRAASAYFCKLRVQGRVDLEAAALQGLACRSSSRCTCGPLRRNRRRIRCSSAWSGRTFMGVSWPPRPAPC